MKRFANILLIAAGDGWQDATLDRSVSLAKENQAHLTVFDVHEISGDLQAIGREKLENSHRKLLASYWLTSTTLCNISRIRFQ